MIDWLLSGAFEVWSRGSWSSSSTTCSDDDTDAIWWFSDASSPSPAPRRSTAKRSHDRILPRGGRRRPRTAVYQGDVCPTSWSLVPCWTAESWAWWTVLERQRCSTVSIIILTYILGVTVHTILYIPTATVIQHAIGSARRPAPSTLFHVRGRNLATELSLWLGQSCGTVCQRQFVARTVYTLLNADSNRTFLACVLMIDSVMPFRCGFAHGRH